MAFFKCKMCGGTIEYEQGATVGVCDSCGTKQTLPRLNDEKRENLYDRANHFRRNNDFDKAAAIYEQILNEDSQDAEVYWSLVLCQYGIEYVEDAATHKRVPTVNRVQYTSIFDDDNYKSAILYADAEQRALYEEEAKTINEIQKGILAISQKEEPFDVFICYKETDQNGRRTQDSVLANDLYHQLTQEGFKVFFARITLEDKLGSAYEPYIFAALNSSKVMVVLGTKPEYFNAAWVKNEWSRYLALVKKSGGKKILIPAYRDMDPYDLPEEFSHLQAQDMSKLGFMQDLIRGIKKIAKPDEPKAAGKGTGAAGGSTANVGTLLERVSIFLEDGEWNEADIYCEKVLDQDPKNARAYIGKLLTQLHLHSEESLGTASVQLDQLAPYKNAVRYADEETAKRLIEYNKTVKEKLDRIERERQETEERKQQISNLQNARANTVNLLNAKNQERDRAVAEIARIRKEQTNALDPQKVKKTAIARIIFAVFEFIYLLVVEFVAMSTRDEIVAIVMIVVYIPILIIGLSLDVRVIHGARLHNGLIALCVIFLFIPSVPICLAALAKSANADQNTAQKIKGVNARIARIDEDINNTRSALKNINEKLEQLESEAR